MAFTESRLRADDSTLTRAPDLVRWGPVIAGVVIGFGLFALLNTLWLAFARAAGDGWVSGNLEWFVGVTAAAALLIAGCIAGALAGVRGTLAGLVNGVTTWGLLVILSLTAAVPGIVSLTAGLGQGTGTAGGPPSAAGLTAESALWTGFWSLLVGLVLAAVGGIIGGKMRRPVVTGKDGSRDASPVAEIPAQRGATADGERRTEVLDTDARRGR